MEMESQREKRKDSTNLMLILISEQTSLAALQGDDALAVQ